MEFLPKFGEAWSFWLLQTCQLNLHDILVQVEVFRYTTHLAVPSLAKKIRCHFMLRRAKQPTTLLCYLADSHCILSLTVTTLDEILATYNVRMPKTTTKSARLRKILTLDEIAQGCNENNIQELMKKIQEREESLAKKKEKQTHDDEEARKHSA